MKILSFTTSLMDKSKDFRYFGLIASFCLMLDLALVLNQDKVLFALKFSDFKLDIELGEMILFFVLFSFYLSFALPLIQKIIIWSDLLLLQKLRSVLGLYRHYDSEECKHYISLGKLKVYAVKKDNKVAYDLYKDTNLENEKDESLCFFSLSLLVSSILNITFTAEIENSISNMGYQLIIEDGLIGMFAQSVLTILFLFCLYLGVIVYGGLEYIDRNRVFMFDHRIDIDG